MDNKKLVNSLNEIKVVGLRGFVMLESKERDYIEMNEQSGNLGVREAINRTYVVCCLHDSTFRMPIGNIAAKDDDGKIIFPPLPFPEVESIKVEGLSPRNIVSGSPGPPIDKYIRNIYKLKGIKIAKEDATLIIGID